MSLSIHLYVWRVLLRMHLQARTPEVCVWLEGLKCVHDKI